MATTAPCTSLTLAAAVRCPGASLTCLVIDPNNGMVSVLIRESLILILESSLTFVQEPSNDSSNFLDNSMSGFRYQHVRCFEMIVYYLLLFIYKAHGREEAQFLNRPFTFHDIAQGAITYHKIIVVFI